MNEIVLLVIVSNKDNVAFTGAASKIISSLRIAL